MHSALFAVILLSVDSLKQFSGLTINYNVGKCNQLPNSGGGLHRTGKKSVPKLLGATEETETNI